MNLLLILTLSFIGSFKFSSSLRDRLDRNLNKNDFKYLRQEFDNNEITDKEYKHVLNVCKKFERKTMKDYQNLYLKCDVLLLADKIEKFRNNTLKN